MNMYEKVKREMEEEYRVKRPKSQELHLRSRKVMPGGDTRTITYFKPYPSFVTHGKGCKMWDVDGHELLDFQNNYTSLIHGHAFPPIVEAMQKQLEKGTIFATPLEQQIELAEMICERTPSIDMIRFCNSGTEATMHAVRAARAYTGKVKIVKLEGGYHGTSDIFEASVEPDMTKVGNFEKPIAVADSKGVPQQALDQMLIVPFNHIEITKKIIEENKDDIAAFIMEQVQGSAGQIAPDPEYLKFVREITQKYGIVLIFDEVVTYRLSTGGAQQMFGVTPDMTTLGKIIGGGTPIGAFGGKKEIMMQYDPARKLMSHSGTFNGNALGMVGGIEALKAFDENAVNHVNQLGKYFREKLDKVTKEIGLNILINGVGSLNNVIFSNKNITEYRGLANSHEEFNELLSLGLINRGIFIAPRGMISISTPMTESDINTCIEAIKQCLIQIKPAIEEYAPELLLK